MANTGTLPGLETKVIPELTKAAELYADARDDRMAHGRVEKERKTALIVLMHEHKLETYQDNDRDPPVSVEIVKGEEKVKVKIKGDEPEEE